MKSVIPSFSLTVGVHMRSLLVVYSDYARIHVALRWALRVDDGLLHLFFVSVNVYVCSLRGVDVNSNTGIADNVSFHHNVSRMPADLNAAIVLDDITL